MSDSGKTRQFIVELIDPSTGCPEGRGEVLTVPESGLAELCSLIGSDAIDGFVDLDSIALSRLRTRFRLAVGEREAFMRLRPWVRADDLSYAVHSGRELALMLKGTKPLAVFSERYPVEPEAQVIPEAWFEPYVTTGRFIKREYVVPATSLSFAVHPDVKGVRVVLYALAGQEWRIDAFILLDDAAFRSGWNETATRLEGSLLGYEHWQTEEFIKLSRPSGSGSGGGE